MNGGTNYQGAGLEEETDAHFLYKIGEASSLTAFFGSHHSQPTMRQHPCGGMQRKETTRHL